MAPFSDLFLLAFYLEHRWKEAEESETPMKDETLIRLCGETTKWLSQTITVNPSPQMVPSYNALLEAAKANHPDNFFLRVLQPLATSGDDLITVGEMMALFGQIRIVLESLQNGG
jgi:hypothetical protein